MSDYKSVRDEDTDEQFYVLEKDGLIEKCVLKLDEAMYRKRMPASGKFSVTTDMVSSHNM